MLRTRFAGPGKADHVHAFLVHGFGNLCGGGFGGFAGRVGGSSPSRATK
jgi:hypothetical protein